MNRKMSNKNSVRCVDGEVVARPLCILPDVASNQSVPLIAYATVTARIRARKSPSEDYKYLTIVLQVTGCSFSLALMQYTYTTLNSAKLLRTRRRTIPRFDTLLNVVRSPPCT